MEYSKPAKTLHVHSNEATETRLTYSRYRQTLKPPTAMPNTRSKHKPDPPVSIEHEHRNIMVTATQVSLELRDFRNSHRLAGSDYTKCVSTVKDLLAHWQVGEMELKTCEDFNRLVNDKYVEQHWKKRPEFGHVCTFCDRGIKFDKMVPKLRSKLMTLFNRHLSKYCVSFSQESPGIDIKSGKDYDSRIQEYESQLSDNFSSIANLWTAYKELRSPFLTVCLPDGKNVDKYVDDICTQFTNICDIMKRWVAADKAYPSKLWDEIILGNVERSHLLEDIKKMNRKKEEVMHHINRREAARQKIAKKLEDSKKEKKRIQMSTETVTNQILKGQEELETKENDLQENEMKINNRKSNSPSYLNLLWHKDETLKIEIAKVRERLETFNRTKDRLNRTDKDLGDAVALLELDLESADIVIMDLRDRMYANDREIARTNQELETKQNKLAAAKRIRQMKFSPESLRKIYYKRSDHVPTDDLTQACEMVAKRIGKSWRILYEELPFAPPRDVDKRRRDMEILDMVSMRKDFTNEDQALNSLQKWRVFNRRGDLLQLIHSLRRIERRRLARKVESKFLRHVSKKRMASAKA